MIEALSTTIREYFPLPPGWKWVKLGALIGEPEKKAIRRGSSPGGGLDKYPDGDIPCFTAGDIKGEKYLEYARKKISEEAFNRAPQFEAGTLFITRVGVNVGQTGIIQGRASANEQIFGLRFKQNVYVNYVYWWSKSRAFQNILEEKVTGAVKKQLTKGIIKDIDIPMPYPHKMQRSLEIQHRILQRIEALMRGVQEAKSLIEEMNLDLDRMIQTNLAEVFSTSEVISWPHKAKLCFLVQAKSRKINPPLDDIHRSLRYVSGDDIEEYTGQLILEPRTWQQAKMPKSVYSIEPNTVLYQSRGIERRKIACADFAGLCSKDIIPLSIRPGIPILPQFLMWSLIAPPFIYYADARSKDENASSKKTSRSELSEEADTIQKTRLSLSEDAILEYELPYPSENAQKAIINHLQNLQMSVKEMKRVQNEDRLALQQFEQSLLEQAFRGNL